MKRLNKEYSLNINNNIDVIYGSVNKEKPNVIYVSCKAWVKNNNNSDNQDLIINNILNNFKTQLKTVIENSKLFKNRFIYDYDLRTSSMKNNNTKNFISFEFFIRQQNTIISLKDIKKKIKDTFQDIINELIVEFETHTFSVTKTK